MILQIRHLMTYLTYWRNSFRILALSWLLSASLAFRTFFVLLSPNVGWCPLGFGSSFLTVGLLVFDLESRGGTHRKRSFYRYSKTLGPFGFDSVCYCCVDMQGRYHCFVSDSVAQLHTANASSFLTLYNVFLWKV